MNLTLRIVSKDFRYLGLLLPLAGWWGLMILQEVLIGTFARLPHQLPPFDMMSEAFLTLLAWLVAFLKIGLLALIVSQLVHKDSTVGSTAFWLSRPISGGRLLASKSLFLILTVILPTLLVEVLLLLFHGVTLDDTLRSIPQIVFLQLLVTAIFMMLAALTPNLPRLIFLGILAVVGLALLQYAFGVFHNWLGWYAHQSQQKVLLQYTTEAFSRTRWDSSLYLSGTIGFSLFLLAVAGVVVCHQYLTRRTKRSMILASSVFPGALLFLSFWNWDFWPTEYPPDKEVLNPEQVTARIEDKSLKFHPWVYGQPKEGLVLRGNIALDNLPPDLVVLPARVSADLFSSSGETLAHHRSGSSYMFRDPSPGSQRYANRRLGKGKAAWLEQSLGGVEFLNLEGLDPQPPLDLFAIRMYLYDRYSGDGTIYSADVDFLVQRDEITRMRLEPGIRYDRGSDHAEILAVAHRSYDASDHSFTIELSGSTHRLTLDGWKVIRYILINSSRGEALFGRRSFFGLDSLSKPLLLSDIFQMLEVRRPSLDFDLPSDGPPIDATWLQGAELVRVETTNLGVFSQSIQIEDFVMERIPGP